MHGHTKNGSPVGCLVKAAFRSDISGIVDCSSLQFPPLIYTSWQYALEPKAQLGRAAQLGVPATGCRCVHGNAQWCLLQHGVVDVFEW